MRRSRWASSRVNVSCPNVHGGGMAFGTCAESAAEVTRAVRAVTNQARLYQAEPQRDGHRLHRESLRGRGRGTGLSLINTLLGMRIDLKKRKPVIANVMGGFFRPGGVPGGAAHGVSGGAGGEDPAHRHGRGEQRARRDRDDAGRRDRRAGGRAEPGGPLRFAPKIIEALPAEMERLGIERLNDIIGGAWK